MVIFVWYRRLPHLFCTAYDAGLEIIRFIASDTRTSRLLRYYFQEKGQQEQNWVSRAFLDTTLLEVGTHALCANIEEALFLLTMQGGHENIHHVIEK